MKLLFNVLASYPVIFLSTTLLTLYLFATLDILVAELRKRPAILRLLLAAFNGTLACVYLGLVGKYNPNSPTMILVFLIVCVGTLSHALLGRDDRGSYGLMGGCCLIKSISIYLISYSAYRILPFDFQEYGGALCQRVVFTVTCLVLCLFVSFFRTKWFPGRELNIAIHTREYNLLQHIWFPASNATLLFCGAYILPLAQVELMSRNTEIYFHALLIAWCISCLISCYIILYVQGTQIRHAEAQQRQISEEQQRADALQELADQHPLTGLLNHRAWTLRARRELEMRKAGAVVMLDLDPFKEVNDIRGHQEGDRVLREVAQLLRQNFRSTDHVGHIVGHIGGDEFCIFMLGQISEDVIRRKMDELLAQCKIERLDGNDKPYTISFSAGIATAPEHGTTLEELVSHADAALYHVKAIGGSNWSIYHGK